MLNTQAAIIQATPMMLIMMTMMIAMMTKTEWINAGAIVSVAGLADRGVTTIRHISQLAAEQSYATSLWTLSTVSAAVTSRTLAMTPPRVINPFTHCFCIYNTSRSRVSDETRVVHLLTLPHFGWLTEWVSEWVSRCLTAHRHNTGYSVPLMVECWYWFISKAVNTA